MDNVHILDPRRLTSVLTGEAYNFHSACKIFGVSGSRAQNRPARVTKPTIESLLRDVTVELALLNGQIEELAMHPLNAPLEQYYSAATLAKNYYVEMGIKPPNLKFKISDKINGIAAQVLLAGRAESQIVRTPVPITYLDFHSQFPAISYCLGCRKILCAK